MPVFVCMVHAYIYIYVWFGLCRCAYMIVHVYICLNFACFELHVLALHTVTMKVLNVSSLQLSAVVLPPKLLKMVSELSLVQPLDPQ